MKRPDAEEQLYQVAQRQGGFFTARQARLAGYADNTHPRHVRNGNCVREYRGIYRLSRFPLATRPDLMLWQLWAHNRRGEPQGTFSHNTALSLHALSDVMPAKLDMTVPPGFQRMAAIPSVLRLHGGRLADDDIEMADGVRVTTPLTQGRRTSSASRTDVGTRLPAEIVQPIEVRRGRWRPPPRHL